MVVSILDSKERRQCDRVGDHYTTWFLQRHPRITTTVARAMDRGRVLAVDTKNFDEYFKRLNECITHETTSTPTICGILTRRAL